MLSDRPQNLKKFRKKSRPFNLKRWVLKKLNWINYPFISAYRGYGDQKKIVVSGHVFRSLYWISERQRNNIIFNALRTLKRFLMNPIPEAKVELQVGKQKYTTTADSAGYYSFNVPNPGFRDGWHDYRVRLIDLDEAYEDEEIMVVEEILIPHNTEFAFISDIDDTFLVSHSTSFLKKVYNLLTKSVHRRKTFEGVVKHYQRLMKGLDPEKPNPFFYVSSSEWNLYDFIVEFCEINELPKGVFLLQDLKSGFRELLKQSGGDHSHKELKIRKIIEMFPDHKFVLLGDNGQRDPEIYHDITTQFPRQVTAVYIRDINQKKIKRIKRIGKQLQEKDVEFMFFSDSNEAFHHSENILFQQKQTG
jgi:phosphatidate phosphatase APP1